MAALAPPGARAQWGGLPDPPDPPDDVPSQHAEPSARPEPADTAPPSPRAQTATSRHELTLGVGPTITTLAVRPSSVSGARYRVTLSLRDLSLQASWASFGARMVGVRLAASVGVGKPVLRFRRPLLSDTLIEEDPHPLSGTSVSFDASLGLLVRAGPVRFGPQLVYSNAWLRNAAGQTVDVDVPYTTPRHLHAPGVGFLVQAHLHPNVAVTLETRVLVQVQSRQPGASLRLTLSGRWGVDE